MKKNYVADYVFYLKQVTEKKIGTKQSNTINVYRSPKAYDNVLISKLWKVLQHTNINNTLMKALIAYIKI